MLRTSVAVILSDLIEEVLGPDTEIPDMDFLIETYRDQIMEEVYRVYGR